MDTTEQQNQSNLENDLPSIEATGPTMNAPQGDADFDTAPGVAMLQTVMVNVYFIQDEMTGQWVLIDAGVPMNASRIIARAAELFGPDNPPQAVILTHGHFDHVGSLHALLKHWDVPVYAHRLEMPYLTGKSAYPPADPTVGGGAFARTAKLFPNHPYDFRPNIREAPEDGTVPHLLSWRWLHTPGHAPGHISLFRESDRVLVAGDAITTQKQESLFGVMSNFQYLHGPPMYFTPDWNAARDSVQKIEALHPLVAATGHGIPMRGWKLAMQLAGLAVGFKERALPRQGRYVNEPAVMDENGIVSLPPPVSDPVPKIVAGIALIAAIAWLARGSSRDQDA